MLNSLTYYRAIVIIFIVAGHSIELTSIKLSSVAEMTLFNLIDGGSGLFVFISGFLFHHVFYKKYDYVKFVKHKFQRIFVPYLVIALPLSLYYVTKQKDWYSGFFLPNGVGFFNVYVEPLFWYIVTGKMLGPYWYIPFIMVMFLLSDLYVKFIQINLKSQLIIAFVALLLAALVHKPTLNLPSTLQLLAYYTPFYLIGIMCSIYKEYIYSTFKGKEYLLLLIVLVLAFSQALSGRVGSYSKAPFVFDGLDLMLFQKIFLSLFFMVYLHLFETKDFKALKLVANTSFAIYFLHVFVIIVLGKLNLKSYVDGSWIYYLLLVLSIVAICTFLALSIKKILRERSSYLIGY